MVDSVENVEKLKELLDFKPTPLYQRPDYPFPSLREFLGELDKWATEEIRKLGWSPLAVDPVWGDSDMCPEIFWIRAFVAVPEDLVVPEGFESLNHYVVETLQAKLNASPYSFDAQEEQGHHYRDPYFMVSVLPRSMVSLLKPERRPTGVVTE